MAYSVGQKINVLHNGKVAPFTISEVTSKDIFFVNDQGEAGSLPISGYAHIGFRDIDAPSLFVETVQSIQPPVPEHLGAISATQGWSAFYKREGDSDYLVKPIVCWYMIRHWEEIGKVSLVGAIANGARIDLAPEFNQDGWEFEKYEVRL